MGRKVDVVYDIPGLLAFYRDGPLHTVIVPSGCQLTPPQVTAIENLFGRIIGNSELRNSLLPAQAEQIDLDDSASARPDGDVKFRRSKTKRPKGPKKSKASRRR